MKLLSNNHKAIHVTIRILYPCFFIHFQCHDGGFLQESRSIVCCTSFFASLPLPVIIFLLNAQFLAAVHVIVYSGAIMVLFLYVIMMLNLNAEVAEPHKSNFTKVSAVFSGGLLLLLLVAILKSSDGLEMNPASNNQIGMVENLGIVLYDKYMLPFEVSALLFLTAMIGCYHDWKKKSCKKMNNSILDIVTH